MSYPYLARTTLKYKSPHATDLSFAKGDTIRVTGPSPEDEDWLVGETLDGSQAGGFPKDFVEVIDEGSAETTENESKTVEETAQEPQPVAQDPSKQSEPPNVLPETDSKVEEVPSELNIGASEPPAPAPKVEEATSEPSVGASDAPAPAPAPASVSASQSESHDDDARPQSMKDRLAFFTAAQNKPSPPPPVKPKPAAGGLTWSQRQKLRQEQEAKEKESTIATSPTTSTPIAPSGPSIPESKQKDDAENKEEHGTAMSAADALSSISKGGSLKERMAALQGVGAFGGAEKKPAPPAPTGKVWKRPTVQEKEPEPEGDVEAENQSPETGMTHKPLPSSEEAREPESDTKDEVAKEEEETEEEQEKARRAAIAARMAKLGARGPMGMMPPAKPVKKPTRETGITAEDKSSTSAGFTAETAKDDGTDQITEAPGVDSKPSTSPKPGSVSAPTDAPVTTPPQSIPISAMPRRTAGPRRRTQASSANPSSEDVSTPAETHPVPLPSTEASVNQDAAAPAEAEAEPDDRLETINSEGYPVPPRQRMIYDEEAPLPKTEEQIKQEKEAEERGRGIGGLEGAKAAGIAVDKIHGAPEELAGHRDEPQGSVEDATHVDEPVADSGTSQDKSRGIDTATTDLGSGGSKPSAGVEEQSIQGGGDREDEKSVAQDEDLKASESMPAHVAESDKVGPMGTAPLTVAANVGSSIGGGTSPRGETTTTMEERLLYELGENDSQNAREEPAIESPVSDSEISKEDEETAPPPPPPRSLGEENIKEDRSESVGHEASEARSEGGDAVVGQEGEETRVPPPPRRIRKAASPVELHGESPTSEEEPAPAPATAEETKGKPGVEETGVSKDEEDAARRSGIAARMAKLGGIKFGIPPPHPMKTHSVDTAGSDSIPSRSENLSPVENENEPAPSPPSTGVEAEQRQPEGDDQGKEASSEEETPEQEAERRRATLARLRAGGALGFGMFNQPSQMEAGDGEEGEDEGASVEGRGPPPPPLPSGRPGQGMPPFNRDVGTGEEEATEEQEGQGDQSQDEEAARPVINTMYGGNDAPPPPGAAPLSPVDPNGISRPLASEREGQERSDTYETTAASTDNRRLPPVPPAFSPPPARQQGVGEETGDENPPPPPPPPPRAAGHLGSVHEPSISGAASLEQPRSPRGSVAPPASQMRMGPEPYTGGGGPFAGVPAAFPPTGPPAPPAAVPAPNPKQLSGDSQETAAPLGRYVSASRQGTKPGYDQLKEASVNYGQGVVRVARGIFAQGKKGFYGDGSASGFVAVVMDNAGVPRPSGNAWGQVIFEQEAGSILRRYDEPRPGDIAAFYDAKLKGKKGLHTYSQHVGSVEEPLVGVISEFEDRKHKLRVLQVERGVPDEVSYRCEDLKGGKVVVFRAGM
ncbi:myosin I binding protein [Cryptococcus gattii E566]|uniref:Myosin I binding protein n=1 Tax=Cryptococcus gattii EJB2 TaxID=1296103 RepID=A0ABR5BZ10_9TREE|nr:myosin I binding protein [Cryptococcus gattii EJB2]KIY35738.1 myosin I binding protein [Cryptococcus gattii E566]